MGSLQRFQGTMPDHRGHLSAGLLPRSHVGRCDGYSSLFHCKFEV
jgi:hypothetical protein